MNNKIKEFEEKLDAWVETDEHKYQCIGYSAGCQCCLEKGEDSMYGYKGREKLLEIISDTLSSTIQEIKRDVAKVFNQADEREDRVEIDDVLEILNKYEASE